MTHDDWRDLLHEYRDGELAEPERLAVAGHLAECKACRLELEGWQGLAAGLLPPAGPADERFVARVLARIEEEERDASPRGAWWLAPAFALAAGVFLLLRSGPLTAPSAELLLLADGRDWVFAQEEPGPGDLLPEAAGELP